MGQVRGRRRRRQAGLALAALALAGGPVSLAGRGQRMVTGRAPVATPQPPTAEQGLPDAPSTVYGFSNAGDRSGSGDGGPSGLDNAGIAVVPCPVAAPPSTEAQAAGAARKGGCRQGDPLQRVVDSEVRHPLTSRQKGYLAVRGLVDPFNLVLVGGEAGIGVASNSHSAFGPGIKGVGRLAGYDLLGESVGEFFGTYLIPSVVHEDPRYRRMQNASGPRRVLHALERTVIAEHDDGRRMPNYATLMTYPIAAELSNLYVPGGEVSGASTAKRIGIGLATDPIGNLVAEFLPDVARRIHVRSVFIQQILNQMAIRPMTGPGEP